MNPRLDRGGMQDMKEKRGSNVLMYGKTPHHATSTRKEKVVMTIEGFFSSAMFHDGTQA